jgi:hypothetical protein
MQDGGRAIPPPARLAHRLTESPELRSRTGSDSRSSPMRRRLQNPAHLSIDEHRPDRREPIATACRRINDHAIPRTRRNQSISVELARYRSADHNRETQGIPGLVIPHPCVALNFGITRG